MEQIKNCKSYIIQQDKKQYYYQYKNIDMSAKEIIELQKVESTKFVSPYLLVPNSLSFSRELNVSYDISKEAVYLFESLYEFEGNYIMGGAETVLSFSHKVEMIKQLCNAFEEINTLGISVKKIDSKSLLYNYELTHLSVDLVNMCSAALDTNEYGVSHTAITNQIKPLKKKLLSNILKTSHKPVITNNVFLGLLIHKILFNQPWFDDASLKEVFAKLTSGVSVDAANSIFKERLFEDIISKTFYEDFMQVLSGKEATKDLNRSPKDYLDLLETKKCICESGYVHIKDAQHYCDSCEGITYGSITFKNTGTHIPLVFPQTYDLAETFTIKKEKIVLRTASKDEVLAMFIPVKGNKITITDENNEIVESEMNSKETHFKIVFEPNNIYKRTVDINGKYQFIFSSLITK